MKKFQQFAKAPVSVAEADQIIYGPVNAPDSGRQVARPVDIFEITPDPAQPRRAIPSAAREQWDGKSDTVTVLLESWIALAKINLALYLDPPPDWQRPTRLPLIAHGLVALIDDAITIRDSGLNNPITIMRNGSGWQIDTGERRWLAHHLLYAYYHDEKYRKIAARDVGQPDVWRQAAENNARQDLNAIGKARQYGRLLMALHEEDSNMRFAPIESFDHEHHYYAQAVELKIPYGQGNRLFTAMGLHNRNEVQRCQTLLTLPDSVWTLGDDLNAPQSLLLKCASLSENEALTLLERLSHNVTIQSAPPQQETERLTDKDVLGFHRSIKRESRKVDKATPDQLRTMLVASEELIALIRARLK